MPALFKGDRSVLFVHIPKTGGSTIERLFRKSGYSMRLHDTADKSKGASLMPFRRCSPQHWHAPLLEEILAVDKFDLVFLLSREPIARFRSEYAMRHHKDPRTDSASVEDWADRAFARYAKNPYCLDNHFRPQHEFHLPNAAVYRLEDGMDAIVADLNERFGLELSTEIPHAMSSVKRGGIASSDVQISPALDERLRSFYAEDFVRYGYAD